MSLFFVERDGTDASRHSPNVHHFGKDLDFPDDWDGLTVVLTSLLRCTVADGSRAPAANGSRAAPRCL